MVRPILAKGKSLERSVAEAVAAGAVEIPVSGGEDFSVGDPMFIAELDGTELEYLGQLVSRTSTTLTVGLPVLATVVAAVRCPHAVDPVTQMSIEWLFRVVDPAGSQIDDPHGDRHSAVTSDVDVVVGRCVVAKILRMVLKAPSLFAQQGLKPRDDDLVQAVRAHPL